MVHGLRTNEKIAAECMAIKTDMSKAYDRVEWNFLEVLMEKMGFDHIWIKWIMACVSSVTFSVLLNGNSHGFIRPERGIRQGDPLSPFLFILCAEALVSRLNTSESSGLLHGIKLTESCPSIHHLLFADDSLLLCKSSTAEAEEVMRCIKVYGEASGQMVNFQKSSIIFGSKVPENIKTSIQNITGIDTIGGEGNYLGLPECFSGSKRKLLSFIREKLQGRLNGWFSKALSQGGKEILIKSIGLALPIFAMSCFKLPKEVCAKLTSAMIEFWWSSGNNRRKISWVAWQKLCRDKEVGCLGFKEVEKFNQALLAKQAWRIWNNPSSLVARILKARYFKRSNFLASGIGSRPSYAWRSILHGKELLEQGLTKVVGNGKGTKVWLDRWIMGPVPRAPLYRQDADVDLTLRVSDLMVLNSSVWDTRKLQELFVDEDIPLILQVNIHRDKNDDLWWGLSRNGVYDTKSGYKLAECIADMNSGQQCSLPPLEKQLWKDIWKTKTSPKLRHFLWRILSGALAVKHQLVSRGIPTVSRCPVCQQGPETICHMLFQCPLAKEVWERSAFPLPHAGFSTSSTFLNMYHLLANSKKPSLNPKIRLAFPWILWQIWMARNLFCFEQRRLNAEAVIDKAMEEAAVWLHLHSFIPDDPPEITVEEKTSQAWEKPPLGYFKCNASTVWEAQTGNVGAAWIVRDSFGEALFHSRRSFVGIRSQVEATMIGMVWTTEALNDIQVRRIILETSSPQAQKNFSQASLPWSLNSLWKRFRRALDRFETYRVVRINDGCNTIAQNIAESALQVQWQQSYLARNGPEWLDARINMEASVVV
ncbi:uncharacterized protein LOC125578967 [Brassica napus]|uniref:uncharacterized protein LOC125578967 n=1 Tax=Brassica napus TaxID=3708 RepID=UPI0020788842|nr:uncharacterized protein LOC125578967 [Brassica napus]